MDAIISLDSDFFVKPTYFGSYFAEKDWNSYEDFKAKSERWLTQEKFLSALNLKDPIRGCVVPENNQTIFNIKNVFQSGYLEKGNTQILLFDAHPNIYYWYEPGVIDSWSLSNFHAYDSTLALFKEKFVDKVIWITPDYVDGEVFKSHFKNFKIFREQNTIMPFVSKEFQVQVKMIKWSEFLARPKNYIYKYFAFTTNPRMVNHTQEELKSITSMIKQY